MRSRGRCAGRSLGRPYLDREPLGEFARVDLQRLGDTDDVVQRDVALAALDLADIGPVQLAGVGERFLAEPEVGPTPAHSRAELGCCRRKRGLAGRARHTPNPIGLMTFYPETLNPVTMCPIFLGIVTATPENR